MANCTYFLMVISMVLLLINYLNGTEMKKKY